MKVYIAGGKIPCIADVIGEAQIGTTATSALNDQIPFLRPCSVCCSPTSLDPTGNRLRRSAAHIRSVGAFFLISGWILCPQCIVILRRTAARNSYVLSSCLNISFSSTMHETPLFLMLGRQARSPVDSIFDICLSGGHAGTTAFFRATRENLQLAFKLSPRNPTGHFEKQELIDSTLPPIPEYIPGQKALLLSTDLIQN